MRRFNTTVLFFFLGILSPLQVFGAGLDLIKITTNPTTPGPNEEVTITIQSFAVDLNTAQIVWYLDKNPMQEGVAQKTLTFHTGDFGHESIVDIVIIPTFGEKLNKRFVVEPSEVDLLWEAETYTPPFYKGKALATFRSMVKITAIPRKNSYTSDPTTFYYKWAYNRIQGLGEATGMNSVRIPAGWPDSAVPVSVNITLPNTEWASAENTNIPGDNPKIVFYEQEPLQGILFHRALGLSETGKGNLFSIRAVPYFFSLDNYLNKDLIYTWDINGEVSGGGYEPTNIQLSKSGSAGESFDVNLRIQNPKRILQEGRVSGRITLPNEE